MLPIHLVLFLTVSLGQAWSLPQKTKITTTLGQVQPPLNHTHLSTEIWKKTLQKGTTLFEQLQSGCYPEKPDPPTVVQLKNDRWKITPWPYQVRGRDDAYPRLPDAALDAIGASNRVDYYVQVAKFPGMPPLSLESNPLTSQRKQTLFFQQLIKMSTARTTTSSAGCPIIKDMKKVHIGLM